MRGLIEGFYGTPWSWDQRIEVCRAVGAAGMDTYLYAPKDDPLHRSDWRTPYPGSVLDGFERLVAEQPLRVGFSVSPGLSMDAGSAEDRAALLGKYRTVIERGVRLVGLLFDDLDPSPGLGTVHGRATAWLREQLPDDVELVMVPLHYIHACYVRSHYNAMEIGMQDAPRPREILYGLVMATGGRVHSRLGGLTKDKVSVHDGQR